MNPGVGWRPGMSPRQVNPPPRERPVGEKPVIRLELKPESAAAVTPSRDDGAEAASWGSGVLGGSTVRVPVNAIYVASALLILLAIAGWVLGWQMGIKRTKDQTPEVRPRPPVSEPADAPSPPALTPTPVKPKADKPADKAAAPPVKSSAGAADAALLTLTAKGVLQGDPREVDLNYLKLAQLTRTEAERAVKFLSENGLEAFAVPVDRAGANTNNPDPTRAAYWLFAAKGITSDEYSNRLTARTNIEATVARLGLRWQKEFRGSSNFSKPGWEKFK